MTGAVLPRWLRPERRAAWCAVRSEPGRGGSATPEHRKPRGSDRHQPERWRYSTVIVLNLDRQGAVMLGGRLLAARGPGAVKPD
jgi:hypothetical protein